MLHRPVGEDRGHGRGRGGGALTGRARSSRRPERAKDRRSTAPAPPPAEAPRRSPPARGSAPARHAPREWVSPALAALAITATVVLAYHNTLRGPLIFDDLGNIGENPHLRHLWPLWDTLAETARPLLVLTFALNYAVGGLDVVGYHLVNAGIHLLAALVLFDVVRRTLAAPPLAARFAGASTGIALASAALWAAHPLGTQAVTYLVQRGESLAGLFYLLTLDAAIRGASSPARAGRWSAVAIAACVLGALTKPVVVSAPLVVLLYDRCFLSASFREALRRRAALYAGLAASWVVLAALAIAAPDPSSGLRGKVSALGYAASEPGVVLHYLRLALWPSPLVLDYGWPIARSAAAIVPPALAIAALLAAAAWLGVRRPRLGFLGLVFVLVLAPTSSVFPIDDLAFEHRMYLALACLVVLAVLAGYEVLVVRARQRALAVVLAVIAVLAASAATIRRNRDYTSELSIWTDVAKKRPSNPRGHNDVGRALVRMHLPERARPEFLEALRLDPHYAEARNNLGSVLVNEGRLAEALPQFRRALADQPDLDSAHFNLGLALAGLSRFDEAIDEYRRFLARRPFDGPGWNALGNAQSAAGHDDLALASYAEAVRVAPETVAAHNNLGIMRVRRGDVSGGLAEFREALRLQPDFAPARRNLEGALRLEARLGGPASRP